MLELALLRPACPACSPRPHVACRRGPPASTPVAHPSRATPAGQKRGPLSAPHFVACGPARRCCTAARSAHPVPFHTAAPPSFALRFAVVAASIDERWPTRCCCQAAHDQLGGCQQDRAGHRRSIDDDARRSRGGAGRMGGGAGTLWFGARSPWWTARRPNVIVALLGNSKLLYYYTTRSYKLSCVDYYISTVIILFHGRSELTAVMPLVGAIIEIARESLETAHKERTELTTI